MNNNVTINTWVFVVFVMLAGIGGYHLAQITGAIGGIMPAEASDWTPPQPHGRSSR